MAHLPHNTVGVLTAFLIMWVSLMGAAVIIAILEKVELGVAGAIGAILGIGLAAILGASTGATYLHRRFGLMSTQPSRSDYGRVFQQYVTRFSWFVGPISGSYGVFKLVELFISE